MAHSPERRDGSDPLTVSAHSASAAAAVTVARVSVRRRVGRKPCVQVRHFLQQQDALDRQQEAQLRELGLLRSAG